MKAHFILGHINPKAGLAFKALTGYFGQNPPEKADCAVVLGGDGALLTAAKTILIPYGLAGFGVNYGGFGFLMNKPPRNLLNLDKEIETAHLTVMNPLATEVEDINGNIFTDFAINDIALAHTNPQQAIDLSIWMNGRSLTRRMRGDGFIVATCLGALGYNASAGGVIPESFDEDTMIATPLCAMPIFEGYISPFIVPGGCFKIRSLTPQHRLTTVVADNRVVSTCAALTRIWRDPNYLLRLLNHAKKPLLHKYEQERLNVERRRKDRSQLPACAR